MLERVQPAGEEVVRAFDEDQLFRFGESLEDRFELGPRTVLVVGALNEGLGNRARLQEGGGAEAGRESGREQERRIAGSSSRAP